MLLVLAALFTQDITWQPATPRQGEPMVISAPGALTGEVAGEPLHFRDGKALAAVPLATNDSMHIQTLSIRWDGAVIGHSVTVRVRTRRVPSNEQVGAAGPSTPPPASALRVRIYGRA